MTDQTKDTFSQKQLLILALEGLRAEQERINNLITLDRSDDSPHPLGDYAVEIWDKFNEPVEVTRQSLELIKGYYVENKVEDAWKEYVNVKTKLMPALSSELLAVIGGVYLQNSSLENMRPTPRRDENSLSFTETAKNLVKEMAENAASKWASVLIVGEEQLSHSEAEVIRLRFPACDLWNLPFTAHEYGFIVAHRPKATKLDRLRETVKEEVNPKNHSGGSMPKPKERYHHEVIEFWERYYENELSPDDKESFLIQHENNILALREGQDAHLCRLFADAFATFIAGPAYVYALVYLRIVPGEKFYRASPSMPPFVARLVVSLEILRWMNEDTKVRILSKQHLPFKDIVKDIEPTENKIPLIWLWIMRSIEIEKSDEQFINLYARYRSYYEDWLKTIEDDLMEKFSKAIPITIDNWIEAKTLKDRLLKADDINDRYSHLAVLNAAWLARHENPTKIGTVESNALQLLSKRRGESAGPDQARSSLSVIRGEEDKYDPDIQCVKKALGNDVYIRPIFDEVISDVINKKQPSNMNMNEIRKALSENEEALECFRHLIRKFLGEHKDGM